MNQIDQGESDTQNRVARLIKDALSYRSLGNPQYRDGNAPVREDDLRVWLAGRGVSETLAARAVLTVEAVGGSTSLYAANQKVYGVLAGRRQF